MMDVLFLDPVAERPYRSEDLQARPLGGTEATVLRVARGLVSSGSRVAIAQRSRRLSERCESGIWYHPYDPDERSSLKADRVVLLRACKLMKSVARCYPEALRFLWLHCFPGARRRYLLQQAELHNFTVLTVSEALKEALLARCGALDSSSLRKRIQVVYNPVAVPQLGALEVVENKLVFFSSPHKGLEQVLENFEYCLRRNPEFKLYIANPGYMDGAILSHPNIVDLGELTHDQVLREVGEAFCVFYPQSRFAETFGLVFAEANALGTPVLAHDLGAAREVLTEAQLVDCNRPEEISRRLELWRDKGRPRVALKPEFLPEQVLNRWHGLLACGAERVLEQAC